jgi:microcystin-dependent protein
MDYMLGEIQLFPYDFTPVYWAECNGQLLQIVQNQALYSLIGIKFGGDGKSTFAVPNLSNSSPISGMKYYIATQGIYPMRP